MQEWGKYIMLIGGVLLIVGVVIFFFGDRMGWIGNLPGDIRIENEHTRFYFPLTTGIIFSLLILLIIQIVKRLL